MKICKIIIFGLFIITNKFILAKTTMPQIHGYIQSRFTTNFDDNNDFMIRRGKLWVDGNVPGLNNLTYKIQGVYRSFIDEGFMIQDVFADWKVDNVGSFRFGRFVPDFMLQRMQPDYEIPVIERAEVINSLIHSTKSMARQIGVQYTYQDNESPIHFGVGAFNANLESPGQNNDLSLLYTSHLQVNLLKNETDLFEIGASGSYRYANNITMSRIYDSKQLIVGNDYRWGIETILKINDWELQAEYVQANINQDIAWGYYGQLDYNVSKTLQINVLTEKYTDLIKDNNNNEWYGLGLNYYFTKNTKLMADFKTQFSSIRNNYLGRLQFQVFFN